MTPDTRLAVRQKLIDSLFRPSIKHPDPVYEWKLNAFHQMLFALIFVVCFPTMVFFIALRIPVMFFATVLITLSVLVPLPFLRKGKLAPAVHIFELVSFSMNVIFVVLLHINDSVFFLFFDSLLAGIFLSFRAAIGWTAFFTAGLVACSFIVPDLTLLPKIEGTITRFRIITSGTHLSTALFFTWAGAFISILFNRYVVDLITSIIKKNESLSLEIAERAAAEETTEAARRFSDQIIAGAGEGILVFDTALRCVVWNPAMERMTGLSFDKVYDMNVEDLFTRLGLAMVVPFIEKAKNGETVQTEEYEFLVESSGHSGIILFLLSPHHFSGNGANGVVALVHDNTEQHRLEETLRQSQKMEAVGQLAGGIAHDFNNQLTSIQGYAQLLRHDATATGREKPTKWADNLLLGVQRSSDLTQKLLAFARKGKIRSVSVDLHDIINEVISILQHSIDKKIVIIKELKAESAQITGDPSLLQNALLNLALNARDAMPDGGTLRFSTGIRTECCHRSDAPEAQKNIPCLTIIIEDTGCGIPPELRSKVFDPFFTTKEPGKGTGMGLAAVYGTIKDHQGIITVDSTVGTGTVFTICLPLRSPATMVEPAAAETAGPKTVASAGKILVIDDEPSILDVAQEVFSDLGFVVVCANNGQEGLSAFSRGTFDCAVVDYMMPGLNGVETVREFRSRDPNLKVILLSGYGLKQSMLTEEERAQVKFMQKPFHFDDLAILVQQVIDKQ